MAGNPRDFTRHVRAGNKHVAKERFGLNHQQFFAEFKHKNLFWVLDGQTIGFGDLRQEDIELIQLQLREDEEFLGYNEHHATTWQQTPHAVIRITHDEITYPQREGRAAERASR